MVKIDYETNLEDFETFSFRLLSSLAQDKAELRRLILAARDDVHLFSLSEHYDILDKIVLYDDQVTHIRLGLHIFADTYFDRPHNHHWSHSSLTLSGSYDHIIFADTAQNSDPHTSHLIPVITRNEKKGDFYTLHHSQYHSVTTAAPNTVTLLVWGPEKPGHFRVKAEALLEAQEKKNKNSMTPERFDFLIEKLNTIGVI